MKKVGFVNVNIDAGKNGDWLHTEPLHVEDFEGHIPIAEMQDTNCAEVPTVAGVYLVIDHREIVYIGKAGGLDCKPTTHLRKRLRAYMRNQKHEGGKDIWAFSEPRKLLVAWRAVPDARAEEKRMLRQYLEDYGALPRANHSL